MTTTLVVTNDFPPRIGGIESFVRQVCSFLDDDVVVLTRAERQPTAAHDAALPFPVRRIAGPLLPTPAVARQAVSLLREYGCDRVLFGAAAPLGGLAGALRSAGAQRILALSHGHEVWWAAVPGARAYLRRVARDVDALGVISDYTARRIASGLAPAERASLVRLPPPVDTTVFVPGEPASGTVVAAARFVRQKGLTDLVEAWPLVLAALPDSRLVLVGDGPQDGMLRRLATRVPHVEVRPSVPHDQMPALLQSGTVFASPVRSQGFGLYAEGLGLAACEAAACGLPVVVGRSGGAPETVRDGVTGSVVPPHDPEALAGALVHWLQDPAAARAAGLEGRRHVTELVGAEQVAARVRATLGLPV